MKDDLDTLAKRLKWARKQRELTQAQLSKAAGVSIGTIGNAEAGIRSKPRELVAIAGALGANPEWLSTGKGDWQAGNTGPVLLIDEIELLLNLRSLPELDRLRIAHRVSETAAAYRRYDATRAFGEPEEVGNRPIDSSVGTQQSAPNSKATGDKLSGQNTSRTNTGPSPIDQAAALPGEDESESSSTSGQGPGRADRGSS